MVTPRARRQIHAGRRAFATLPVAAAAADLFDVDLWMAGVPFATWTTARRCYLLRSALLLPPFCSGGCYPLAVWRGVFDIFGLRKEKQWGWCWAAEGRKTETFCCCRFLSILFFCGEFGRQFSRSAITFCHLPLRYPSTDSRAVWRLGGDLYLYRLHLHLERTMHGSRSGDALRQRGRTGLLLLKARSGACCRVMDVKIGDDDACCW